MQEQPAKVKGGNHKQQFPSRTCLREDIQTEESQHPKIQNLLGKIDFRNYFKGNSLS
jgi:hypothetical protein